MNKTASLAGAAEGQVWKGKPQTSQSLAAKAAVTSASRAPFQRHVEPPACLNIQVIRKPGQGTRIAPTSLSL